jgi:hypothetical protein
VYTTWQQGFPDDKHLYRNKRYARAEREAAERAAFEARCMAKVEGLYEDRMRRLEEALALSQRVEPSMAGSPHGHLKSSHGSAPGPGVTESTTFPVDEIQVIGFPFQGQRIVCHVVCT